MGWTFFTLPSCQLNFGLYNVRPFGQTEDAGSLTPPSQLKRSQYVNVNRRAAQTRTDPLGQFSHPYYQCQ